MGVSNSSVAEFELGLINRSLSFLKSRRVFYLDSNRNSTEELGDPGLSEEISKE